MQRCFCYQILILLVTLCCASCSGMLGDHSLGNNLSLLEGDRMEDKVIVYCSAKSVGVCKSGIYVVPTYERHYRDGNYAEYVEEAKSNGDWVIAKSVQIEDKKENYWIISKDFDIKSLDCGKNKCDSILQSHVTGPMNLIEFNNKKKVLNIELHF